MRRKYLDGARLVLQGRFSYHSAMSYLIGRGHVLTLLVFTGYQESRAKVGNRNPTLHFPVDCEYEYSRFAIGSIQRSGRVPSLWIRACPAKYDQSRWSSRLPRRIILLTFLIHRIDSNPD